MILLEAAASRFALVAAPYGISCQPVTSLRESIVEIGAVNEALAPLVLPEELRAFWTWWDAKDFQRPALDGFLSPRDALVRREKLLGIGYPSPLIPIAEYGRGLVWMELQSDDHPGSRLYHGAFNDPELHLWTIGVSGLLDLLTECLYRAGVISWGTEHHHLDAAVFTEVLAEHHIDLGAPAGDWAVALASPEFWPSHWRLHSPR
jgi:hypothetical protein